MKAFDWQRMALDKVPVEFLARWRCAASTPSFWSLFSQNYRTARRAADVAV
jgi:hypothetical protein